MPGHIIGSAILPFFFLFFLTILHRGSRNGAKSWLRETARIVRDFAEVLIYPCKEMKADCSIAFSVFYQSSPNPPVFTSIWKKAQYGSSHLTPDLFCFSHFCIFIRKSLLFLCLSLYKWFCAANTTSSPSSCASYYSGGMFRLEMAFLSSPSQRPGHRWIFVCF